MSNQQAHHLSGLSREDETTAWGRVGSIVRDGSVRDRSVRDGDDWTPMHRIDVAQMVEVVNRLANRRWAAQEDMPQSIALALGIWGCGLFGRGDRLLGQTAMRGVLGIHWVA